VLTLISEVKFLISLVEQAKPDFLDAIVANSAEVGS
jgi:hypothetical protein